MCVIAQGNVCGENFVTTESAFVFVQPRQPRCRNAATAEWRHSRAINWTRQWVELVTTRGAMRSRDPAWRRTAWWHSHACKFAARPPSPDWAGPRGGCCRPRTGRRGPCSGTWSRSRAAASRRSWRTGAIVPACGKRSIRRRWIGGGCAST